MDVDIEEKEKEGKVMRGRWAARYQTAWGVYSVQLLARSREGEAG